MAVFHVTYYTDPACPWSWANEPELRRLEVQFAGRVSITYVMAGLARSFDHPLDALRDWLEAAAASSMPVDSRLWLDAPPSSSYPACLAVKAAAEQGLGGPYLRRAREGFACDRTKLDNTDALVSLARTVPGLDVDRFAIDLASNAVVEAFGADLDRSRGLATALGEGPLPLPTAEFRGDWEEGPGDQVQRVLGLAAPGAYVAAALAAGVEPANGAAPGVEEVLRRFGRLGAAEVAAACDLPGPRAPAELWRLAGEWRTRFGAAPSGGLWSLA
jgi:predicted DsbA family dithiol-disulfide isomerase